MPETKTVVLPSEFDLFRKKSEQTAILQEYFETIQVNNVSEQQLTYDIQVPGCPGVFRDLSNSQLIAEVEIVKDDGSSIGTSDVVAPANNFLHTLFSDVSVTVCGTKIQEKSGYYAYRAFIETLLSSSSDVLSTRARAAGWELDTEADDMDKVIATKSGTTEPNKAFVERKKRYANGIVVLAGRLHVDLFHQDLDLPPNCNLQISLTRSDKKFALMAAASSSYKVKIHSLKFRVRSKMVDPNLIAAHRDMLQSTNYCIPLNKVMIKPFTVGTGVKHASYANAFLGPTPKRVVIGFLPQTRVNGEYNLNPFKFENHSLTRVSMTVNGRSIPHDKIDTDFSKDKYRHAYLNFLAEMELDVGNRAISLSPELWASAYNLHAFKITPGVLSLNTTTPNKTGVVDIEFDFANATTAPLEVLVYSETDSCLEIDKNNTAYFA